MLDNNVTSNFEFVMSVLAAIGIVMKTSRWFKQKLAHSKAESVKRANLVKEYLDFSTDEYLRVHLFTAITLELIRISGRQTRSMIFIMVLFFLYLIIVALGMLLLRLTPIALPISFWMILCACFYPSLKYFFSEYRIRQSENLWTSTVSDSMAEKVGVRVEELQILKAFA